MSTFERFRSDNKLHMIIVIGLCTHFFSSLRTLLKIYNFKLVINMLRKHYFYLFIYFFDIPNVLFFLNFSHTR